MLYANISTPVNKLRFDESILIHTEQLLSDAVTVFRRNNTQVSATNQSIAELNAKLLRSIIDGSHKNSQENGEAAYHLHRRSLHIQQKGNTQNTLLHILFTVMSAVLSIIGLLGLVRVRRKLYGGA